MGMEYKYMSTQELADILRGYVADMESTMNQIDTVLKSNAGVTRIPTSEKIRESYARIKESLKEAHHYSSLTRNEVPSNTFYSHSFTPAVHEAYVHCSAKVNEKDIYVIFRALYEAQYDIEYVLP